MALVMSVKIGESVLVDGREFKCVSSTPAPSVVLEDQRTGIRHALTDTSAMAILPGVFVQVGMSARLNRKSVSLAFMAPAVISIHRKEP